MYLWTFINLFMSMDGFATRTLIGSHGIVCGGDTVLLVTALHAGQPVTRPSLTLDLGLGLVTLSRVLSISMKIFVSNIRPASDVEDTCGVLFWGSKEKECLFGSPDLSVWDLGGQGTT